MEPPDSTTRRPILLASQFRYRSEGAGTSLLGVGLSLVGLVAPLTPSDGCPSATAVGVFAAAPVLLLFAFASRGGGIARAILSLQGGSIAGGTLMLLVRPGCLG